MPQDIIAASAPICGMTDLIVDYETTRPDLRPYSEQMMGGKPDDIPEKYFERSPINFVQNIKGSLLIIQGAQDPNVTPKNVEDVRTRLDKNTKKYDVLIFDDEGHGIRKTKNQKVLFKRLADFFDEAL
jgi:dipeptidyl aminopeptidase/acylaminoacyl peptidase